MRICRRINAFVSIFIAVLALPLFTNVTRAEQRLALLIGNSRYENATPLRNPENDIELVELTLKKAKFRTFTGRNLGFAAMQNSIKEFAAVARDAERPTLLIYFAGHGAQVHGRNFLIPVDAKVENLKDLSASSVDAEKLLKQLDKLDAKLIIFVLDACRDDPFENKTRGLKRGLSPIESRPGRFIAFSTAPGKVAQDGDAGTSPYASAFAEASVIPGLSLEEVFRRVRRTVVERTAGKQEPWEKSAIYNRFVFVEKASGPALGNHEEEIWKFAAAVNSSEGYARYLEMFPRGLFAKLAKLKIAAINKEFTYGVRRSCFRSFACHSKIFRAAGPKMCGYGRCSTNSANTTTSLFILLLNCLCTVCFAPVAGLATNQSR